MSSLLPHDLCHGRSTSLWPPTHTVKRFSLVNEAKVDAFLEFSTTRSCGPALGAPAVRPARLDTRDSHDPTSHSTAPRIPTTQCATPDYFVGPEMAPAPSSGSPGLERVRPAQTAL